MKVFLFLGPMSAFSEHSLLPVGSELARLLVVAPQPVHTALDEDKPELGVLVLPIALQVLADRHGLLDEAVKVLGDGGSHACNPPLSETSLQYVHST